MSIHNTKKRTPIKRHKGLQNLSREHHFILLFAWKIRQGINKAVEPARIKNYIDWVHQKYLIPHIEFEKKYIVPLSVTHREKVEELFESIAKLLENISPDYAQFSLLEQNITEAVRFEERSLFNEIQELNEFHKIAESWNFIKPFKIWVDYEDQFWNA